MLPRRPLNYSTVPFNYVAKLRPLYTLKVVTVTKIIKKSFHFISLLNLPTIPLTNPFHGPHEDLPLPHGVGLTIANPSP